MSASVIDGPAAHSGLFSVETRQPIPLDHVCVEAHVVDAAARVTIRQSYRNVENVRSKSSTLPLDEGAAVCGFEATLDGVRYVGARWNATRRSGSTTMPSEAGHGGFLLDEERADVFTASLGNMKPGSMVELSITYVTELAAEGEAVRFTLPTTVSPRYAPAEDQEGRGPDAGRGPESPAALHVALRLQLRDGRDDERAIRSVAVAVPSVELELDGPRAKVRLAQRTAAMDRDLVIVLGADNLAAPHAVVERGGRAGGAGFRFSRGSSRRPRRPR